LPHAPQFFGSLLVSMQVPLQSANGKRHWHWPEVQSSVSAHVMPHTPQFSGSPGPIVCVQVGLGVGHMRLPAHVQEPAMHVSPTAHFMPHAPQLARSRFRSTQPSTHAVLVASAHTHMLPTHDAPIGQPVAQLTVPLDVLVVVVDVDVLVAPVDVLAVVVVLVTPPPTAVVEVEPDAPPLPNRPVPCVPEQASTRAPTSAANAETLAVMGASKS
jgi:hypothetical protein